MIPMTLERIAEVVGGTLYDADDPSAEVTGTVEFDSRKIGPGGLFLALPGARSDGHDHAAAAIEAGAVAVLAARPVGVPAIVVPALAPTDTNALALEHDTDGSGAAVLAALAALARSVVDTLTARGLTVVGVTGSAGKTSTKDLLAAVLSPLGPVIAPPGSFNNELGHPWTALRADRGHPVPRAGDVRARSRAHRDTRRHRAAEDRRGAQCRHRAPRRVRVAGSRSPKPRANWSRHCPTPRRVASRCSTPTISSWRRWQRGPTARVVWVGSRRLGRYPRRRRAPRRRGACVVHRCLPRGRGGAPRTGDPRGAR